MTPGEDALAIMIILGLERPPGALMPSYDWLQLGSYQGFSGLLYLHSVMLA
ncbi:MAG: hypothetical protein ABIM74_02080 [candidate division WOR-3 bacterium]